MSSVRTPLIRSRANAALVAGLLVTALLPGAATVSATVAVVSSTPGSIAAGEQHTCAVKTDGTVWCWGLADSGQLGDGTLGDANAVRLHPVQVIQGAGMLTGVKAVAAGWFTTCALKTDGTVWCWGYDGFAQLGDGTIGTGRYQTRLTPVQVILGSGKMTGVIAIATGGEHTCALRSGGTVWCWGDDFTGALGDGTRGNANHIRLQPVQVVQGSGKMTGVASIATRDISTCAVKTAGGVWCWGSDSYGQLGDGTRGNTQHLRLKPVQVVYGTGTLTSIGVITLGTRHTCAVKTTGTMWCWGWDVSGQLGDGTLGGGTMHIRLKPVQAVFP